MTKRKEDWIYILTPDGRQLVASPSYILHLLGLQRLDVPNIYNRVERLENKIDRLEFPLKKQKVLELLANGESHNKMWLENRIPCDWYTCRKLTSELLQEGKIRLEKAGTQDMFKLA